MKKTKRKKLATKVILSITIGLIVAFTVLTSIIAVSTSKIMVRLQKEYISIIAEDNARVARQIMETMINKQSVLISAILNLDTIPQEQRISNLRGLMEKMRAEEKNILSLYYAVGPTDATPNGFSAYVTSGKLNVEMSKTAILSEAGYKLIENSRNMAILDPYKKTIDGKEYLVISVVQPIIDAQNNFVGVVGSDIDTSLLANAKYNNGGYKSFSSIIVCGHKTVIMNTIDPTAIGKSFIDTTRSKNPELILEVAKGNEPVTMLDEFKDGSNQYRGVVPFYVGNYSTVWLSLTSVSEKEFMAPVFDEIIAVIIICILVLVVISSLCLIIINRSLRPVMRLEEAAAEIAEGNLNVNMPQPTDDEIGALTQSFMNVRDTILLLVEKINNINKDFSNGEIDAEIPEFEFKGQFANVAASINNTLRTFVEEMLLIIDIYGEIGNGNFDATLKQLPGKKAIVNERFNELRSSIKSINDDVRRLIDGAIEGKLDTHVDTQLYKGDWQKLTAGLNNLLETVNKPIVEANMILEKLSNGNFDVTFVDGNKGSFASMMNSLQKMINSTSSYINEITESLEAIANGDLSRSISREYIGQFNSIKMSINGITEKLTRTIQEIKNSAGNVLTGARQISETSMHLATGTSNQASAVVELNASISEINRQSQENAEKTKEANSLSQKSIQGAKEGNAEMQSMLKSMEEIKEASKNISNIIRVIDDIAFQTNILSLNAAVEAARAGTYGKGFAVVAEEVRTLASRSSEAAKQTSELIENAIEKVTEGTDVAAVTAKSLETIVTDINAVSEIINSIYEASASQRESIAQVTVGINQINEVVQSNSSTSEEAAAAAQELSSQSELLSEVVSKFKVTIVDTP